MFKTFLKIPIKIIFSLVLILSIFNNVPYAFASENVSLNSADITSEITTENSSNSIENDDQNNIPDLGDDQAFPFIPGFGKNSGKD